MCERKQFHDSCAGPQLPQLGRAAAATTCMQLLVLVESSQFRPAVTDWPGEPPARICEYLGDPGPGPAPRPHRARGGRAARAGRAREQLGGLL